ncbi:RagB/SusD family nutrient uptake outer membrane protein [Flavobacterium sp.]|uniref:RagB/SusD family nutrient uptake outer membrane protein n=1 Tax=Flavobacterium sp. TaxID=239 RepID=UPI003D0F4EE9
MKKHIIGGVLFGLTLVGCSQDYLDTKPSEFVTPEQVSEVAAYDPSVFDGFLNGIYATMYKDGVGGTEDHDDFGQKGIDIYSDMLSGDMALSRSTYGWYRNLTQLTATEDFTRAENSKPWRFYYRMIFGANSVIDAQGGNDVVPSTAGAKQIMGQAKALRAFAYFNLQQLYANEYIPNQKSIVLKLTKKVESKPRNTCKEVMDQVIKDYQDAISLLDGFQRPHKGVLDQNVVKGLAAYAYGYIGDATSLAKGRDLALDVINNSGGVILSTTDVLGGFNDLNSTSWLWGVDLKADMGFDLISWWGQMDVFTYSYQWAGDRKAMDRNLFNKIPANDLRRKQFNTSVAPTATRYLLPYYKFYHPNRVEGGQRTVETDIVFMRIEEMYLLYAEYSAKTGMESEAIDKLKTLLSKRYLVSSDYSFVDTLTGAALLNEIYLQTRIELWGEGKSYYAMKRNKATINRGANHLSFQGVDIPYNDPRLTLEIPQAEFLANPFL